MRAYQNHNFFTSVTLWIIGWIACFATLSSMFTMRKNTTYSKPDNSGSISRNRLGNPVKPMEKTYEMALDPE